MLKQKHKQIIQQQATKVLTKKTHQCLSPVKLSLLPHSPSASPKISQNILSNIDEAISQSKLNEFSGSNNEISHFIRDESTRIAEDLHPIIFDQAVQMLREDLPSMRRKLEEDLLPFDSCDENMMKLRKRLEANSIGRQQPWAGARVYIGTSHRSDLEQRGFYSVITKDEALAENVAWLFCQLRDSMRSYLNYLNKYEFYGVLAEVVGKLLQKGVADTMTILLAVFEAAQAFRSNSHDGVVRYFDRRQEYLVTSQQFIGKHDPALI